MMAFLLTACMNAGLWLANAPGTGEAHLSSGMAYGTLPEQTLNVYTPPHAQKAPVIVFFYGGRWTFGEKEQYAFIGRAFAEKGYVVVIANHRKYPSVKFPAFVEDGAQAVAWTVKHIAQYGGAPDHLYLMGHSSGAHIAALLTADERYLKKAGVNISVLKGFVGLAGPYAFTPDEPDLIDMFGPPGRYPHMQVTSFIDGKEPPMLLLHGAKDTTVKEYNLERLQSAIKQKGGQVDTKLYPDLDHTGIIASLTWLKDTRNVVRDDILAFLKNTK